ncbi:hypothetical protein EHF33_15675 [Deinococcus psychrotolerans]|uniref:Uncharacterized protein n=1 Tax=Deinococcus psychrotolerans TaxID=2489213 RepID=A0A3G8YH84_9DEIO|nr:hypothetical protein [Deinococcus psychrotolerans]AZI44325.1 hypothetical protein EHF33_15675 [Deinococcus psychrotolerans]
MPELAVFWPLSPTARSLGLLLLRCNDWVSPIRAEARAALDVYDQPALAFWWIEYLPLVLRFGPPSPHYSGGFRPC